MQSDDAGSVFGWGWGESGQLGRGNTNDIEIPVLVKPLSNKRIGRISCGLSHSLAVTDTGELYVWGKGAYGRLGTGTEFDCRMPSKLNIEKKRIIDGCCGGYHSAVLTSKNELYVFGRGDKGQLGLGVDNAMRPSVVPFFADKKVAKVACGNSHTIVCTSWYLNGLKDLLVL
uniref:Uncharacterized protein n=1 Tax=Arcella intermedia TaxID=1963864 RepID=A0A6B2LL79_9EUKA